MPDGFRWFVIHCKSSQERTAKVRLEEQGYETYLPLVLEAGKASNTVRPLFPCYLFAHVDPLVKSLAPISSTRGVIRVVRFGHQYPVVSDDALLALRNLAHQDGVIYDDMFDVGDKVEMTEGLFATQPAVIAEKDNGGLYVTVSLGWVGRISVRRNTIIRAR